MVLKKMLVCYSSEGKKYNKHWKSMCGNICFHIPEWKRLMHWHVLIKKYVIFAKGYEIEVALRYADAALDVHKQSFFNLNFD